MARNRELKRPIAVDLFSGAGGMSLGFEQAGFDIALAVDSDAYHVATHHRNFPYGQSILKSVVEVDRTLVQNLLGPKVDVALVFGGPPCQGFSNMGLRDEGDPRNSLVDEFCRIVLDLNPQAFVMENVPGMGSGSTAPILERAIQTLRDGGFKISNAPRILDASHFGVPQKRRRLFLVGIRNDLNEIFCFPEPDCGSSVTVREAISDLPNIDAEPEKISVDQFSYDDVPASENLYALIARGLEPDPECRARPRIWDSKVATGCVRVRHGEKSIELYESTPPGSMVPGHKLPKLSLDGQCPTLRAGTNSERGSHTAPRPVHPTSPRVITPREAARLHGYPDWFCFYPGKFHAYRQIGNSVCPPVAREIGVNVLKVLGIRRDQIALDPVELPTSFKLAEDRPKGHKRISIRVEFPKVIDKLWENSFDQRTKELVKPDFGPKEIASAMKSSGAEMPRVRPNRFIRELTSYRHSDKVLATPLASGFSVAITDDVRGTGRFVPTETLGAIGQIRALRASSNDLTSATPVRFKNALIEFGLPTTAWLENPRLISKLASGKWAKAQVERDLLGEVPSGAVRVKIYTGEDAELEATLIRTGNGKFPSITHVIRALQDHQSEYAVILTALTTVHVAAVFLMKQGENVLENWRDVFILKPRK